MINTHNLENQKLTSKGNLLFPKQLLKWNKIGGEFSDEQNDDTYQNTEHISQVNAHADGNEFEPSSLIESTSKPNNAKEKEKKRS